MKLATRKNGTRDGELLVVSRDNRRAVVVGPVAPTLQSLMDDWSEKIAHVQSIAAALEAGERSDAFDVDCDALHSPLPRAYAWIDGCLLYTSPSPRDQRGSRMPSSA